MRNVESNDEATSPAKGTAEPLSAKTRNGVALLPIRPGAQAVTTELVLRLIEESECEEFRAIVWEDELRDSSPRF